MKFLLSILFGIFISCCASAQVFIGKGGDSIIDTRLTYNPETYEESIAFGERKLPSWGSQVKMDFGDANLFTSVTDTVFIYNPKTYEESVEVKEYYTNNFSLQLGDHQFDLSNEHVGKISISQIKEILSANNYNIISQAPSLQGSLSELNILGLSESNDVYDLLHSDNLFRGNTNNKLIDQVLIEVAFKVNNDESYISILYFNLE